MAFREVRVFEVRRVLRLWLGGEGLRTTSRLPRRDRETVRRYIEAAQELGLDRAGDEDQLTDRLLGGMVADHGGPVGVEPLPELIPIRVEQPARFDSPVGAMRPHLRACLARGLMQRC